MRRMSRVFKSGNSQAIRLPKEFHLTSKQVAIEKKGKVLIIFEVSENLGTAYHLLSSLPDDFYGEGRIDSPPQEREAL